MASIFLSYARDDGAIAARVAAALEAADYSVWWDRQIGAGSRFAAEIEEALKAADLVVVLWSKESVRSAWVHDEAAAGRDSGRLVPVLIDQVDPPLGFRQYQVIDLSKTRRGTKAFAPLIDAIAQRAGMPDDPTPPPTRRSATTRLAWRISALISVAALLLLAGLWFSLFRLDGSPSHVVVVAAADGGEAARSQELARSVALDLGRFRVGALGELTILGGSNPKAANADFRVEVGMGGGPAGMVRADMTLMSARSSEILWADAIEAAPDRFTDLRQQAVAKLGDALSCVVEAAPYRAKISRDVLGLHIRGCVLAGDLTLLTGDESAISIFRQITGKAPDFAPGWAYLALLEGISLPATPLVDQPVRVKSARAHLAKAKRIDPTVPEIFAAEAILLINDQMKHGRALAVLDHGLALHPGSARLHDMRSGYLAKVGRMNEGVSEARRAMDLNPLSPYFRDSYISGLAYAGRTAAAFEELKRAEAIWPGSAVLSQVRYRLDLRYGEPGNALRMLRERGAGDSRPVPMDTAWQKFIEARMDSSPARVEQALAAFRERYRREPGDIPGYLQALGTFGRVDEAYEAVKPTQTLDSLLFGTETLFRPHMRSIRADRRFIGLAAKLGLLAYWQKSNVWPDFCQEPQLPYDCGKEAARLPPEQRRPFQPAG